MHPPEKARTKTVALAGGVGGAKLAAGLQAALEPGRLTVVVNTADDFDLWGLRICPDLDTVMYSLAGVENPETGWGVAGETFEALGMLERYGENAWFKLGDRDLATHVLRTQRLRSGAALTEVTADLSGALGIPARILPMCDEPVSTVIETPGGDLEFQDYFVRRGQEDEVIGVRLRGIESATLPGGVSRAIAEADLIVFCPSNPIVSVGPILAVPGLRGALAGSRAPKVAVSPIVGGRALKGPAGKMLECLGHEVSAAGVARLYSDLLDGFVLDKADEGQAPGVEDLKLRAFATDAVMRDAPDRGRLAREVISFASALREGS